MPVLRHLARCRTHSNETKTKISESLKGEKNPFFNKVHSEASKLQISFTALSLLAEAGSAAEAGFAEFNLCL